MAYMANMLKNYHDLRTDFFYTKTYEKSSPIEVIIQFIKDQNKYFEPCLNGNHLEVRLISALRVSKSYEAYIIS